MKLKICFFALVLTTLVFSNIPRSYTHKHEIFYILLKKTSQDFSFLGYKIFTVSSEYFSATAIVAEESASKSFLGVTFITSVNSFKKHNINSGYYAFKNGTKNYFVQNPKNLGNEVAVFRVLPNKKGAFITKTAPSEGPENLEDFVFFLYSGEEVKKVVFLEDGMEYSLVGKIQSSSGGFAYLIERESMEEDLGKSFISESEEKLYMLIRSYPKMEIGDIYLKNISLCSEIGFSE